MLMNNNKKKKNRAVYQTVENTDFVSAHVKRKTNIDAGE